VKLAVITISDRASRGEYEDLSGPAIETLLREAFPEADIVRDLVPDRADLIRAAFERLIGADYIFTTGGTGISPADLTPETSEAYCDKSVPGIAEMLRMQSYAQTPNALFSRGYAGIKGTTIIVNFPGSVKAASFCISLLIPVLKHGVRMLRGEDHGTHGNHGKVHG
jgi:molybdopterin adenylyltransferase